MKYPKGSFVTVPNIHMMKGLTPYTQTLYVWLCHHANSEGECFPSRQTLAKECGCSVRQIDTSLGELEFVGVIGKENRLNGKEFTTNLYQIHLIPRAQPALGNAPDAQPPSAQPAQRTKPPFLTKPINMVSEKISDTPCELTYEDSPEETYQTKAKTFKKLGLNYQPKRTSKQETALEALSLITYCRKKGEELGYTYYDNSSDEVKQKKRAKEMIEEFGSETREMIDFYITSDKAERIQPTISNVFSVHSIQEFKNRNRNAPKSEKQKESEIEKFQEDSFKALDAHWAKKGGGER